MGKLRKLYADAVKKYVQNILGNDSNSHFGFISRLRAGPVNHRWTALAWNQSEKTGNFGHCYIRSTTFTKHTHTTK